MTGVRRFAVLFLSLQAVGAALWWVALLGWPETRRHFRAHDAPDATLLAFVAADGLLFVGTSAGSALGLGRRRRWAWPLLCLHTGAAAYAALYCWALVALTGGDGIAGAVLMTPSLVIPGLLVWALRPAED